MNGTNDFAAFLDSLLFPSGKPRPIPHAVYFAVGGRDAAWVDDWRAEAVRLLRESADLIERGEIGPNDRKALRDGNGNTVGGLTIGL